MDMQRIEGNVQKMVDAGAPPAHIDGYLASEGLTAEQFRSRSEAQKPSFLDTLKENVTAPFKGGLAADKFREGVAGAKDVSRDISKAEGGVRGAISEGLITPAMDAAAGIASLPNLALEELPAWASSKIGGLVGGKTDVEPTSFFPSFQENQEAITNLTGLSRNPAESRLGRVGQSAVSGAMVAPTMPVLGLLAGAGSEAAGQAAEGTSYEVPARMGAATLPFAGRAAVSALRPTPGVTVGKALDSLSPDELNQVLRLIDDSKATGTQITSAEAIAQVTGKKGPLIAQRAVEESTQATPNIERVQSIMRDRPAANRAAFEATIPAPSRPLTEIAPAVQGVARGRVEAERSLTNARTKPLYDTTVEVGEVKNFGPIAKDPVLVDAISAVRRDRIKWGNLDGLPDNHMKVLDATKKYLDDLQRSPEVGGNARANIASAKGRLTSVMDDAYPDYAAARVYQKLRRDRVEGPLERSPTGRVADQEKLAGQYKAVFGDPLEVTPREVSRLVREIASADPILARDFVSRYLGRAFNKAHKPKTTKETAGSNFANEIRGDVDIAANVEAAVKALPDGAKRWAALDKVMTLYEAQGRRLPGGSPTQVKQEFARTQREGFIPRLAALHQGLANKFGDWRYGRNLEGMAEILVMSPQELGRLMMSRPSVVAPSALQYSVGQEPELRQ